MQPIQIRDVVMRKKNGAKGLKDVNRWSTASSIDIEADFEVMANKVWQHVQLLSLSYSLRRSGLQSMIYTLRN